MLKRSAGRTKKSRGIQDGITGKGGSLFELRAAVWCGRWGRSKLSFGIQERMTGKRAALGV